jgi:hypothetical protein
MDAQHFAFAHRVTVPCLDGDPSPCLVGAWNVGACGEDWVWSWTDSDHVRISFKREADRLSFVSCASI